MSASVRSDGVNYGAKALVQDRFGIALCSLFHLLSQWLLALPLVPQQNRMLDALNLSGQAGSGPHANR